MSQKNSVLKYLQLGKSLTPLQALTMFGIMRLSARINEIRKDGHRVHSIRVLLANDKCVAKYFIEKKVDTEK